MSEEVEMTPITPEEGGAIPPKVTPSEMTASSTAPTVKLKPVIRKPMIRKPVIGGAKPVTLKPATGTPPPPAAVPEAATAPTAAPAAPAAPAAAAPSAGPQLKAITSPIAAQAILRKTGIIAEGILTPAQAQAAKTKTSRISLESAIGVAPVMKSAAPMKTIKLRRPTDIPPAGGTVKVDATASKPAVSPLKPDPAPAPATEQPTAPATAPTEATTASATPADAAPSTITQKKTLKLQRPGFKRPTVSGLRRPGEPAPAPTAPATTTGSGDVADIPAVADLPDIKPMAGGLNTESVDDGKTIEGAPTWLNVTTLVAGIAALVVIGLCTWTLFCEAVGPAAGPNDLASFHSDTDYRR